MNINLYVKPILLVTNYSKRLLSSLISSNKGYVEQIARIPYLKFIATIYITIVIK